MGAPANSVWLPLLLMAIMLMALAPLAIAQNQNDTTNSSPSSSSPSSNSPSSSTTIRPSTAADVVVGGDLNKAARVEELNKDLDSNAVTPKPASDGGFYDVVDVLAATSAGVGRPKSGQTTRIYTTGDVNDEFWLKHLGDDFKHAIHLQVGGTNDDYNRIINQTSNGVHEEVHHEYLPGAERPGGMQQQQRQQHQQQQQQQQEQLQEQEQQQQHQLARAAGYGQPNLVTQLSLDSESMALKDNYLRQQAHRQQQEQQQEQQHQHQRYAHGYTRPNTRYNTHTVYRNNYPHMHAQHNTQHTHTHTHTHTQHTHADKSRNTPRYRPSQNINTNPAQAQSAPSGPSFISSSEDTLHTSQSQAAPTSAMSPGSNGSRRDDLDRQLPFKSAFNDYGSRPTRDLTYLLYKRGL
ncbi:mediator of RNA polymerase II transcription subunit 15 [Drosophila montana]|uniref:mediator of RNA polymerase II transcription subunit 15 n=1 Tax=Drosophila montana TaxID=40370 RepID=UPI00313CD52E